MESLKWYEVIENARVISDLYTNPPEWKGVSLLKLSIDVAQSEGRLTLALDQAPDLLPSNLSQEMDGVRVLFSLHNIYRWKGHIPDFTLQKNSSQHTNILEVDMMLYKDTHRGYGIELSNSGTIMHIGLSLVCVEQALLYSELDYMDYWQNS